jgi:hypothetical protein
MRGNPQIRPVATPRDLSFGFTWKLALRRARGKRNRGDSGNQTKANPEGATPGGTRETTIRSRKICKAGRPAEKIVGDTERLEDGATRKPASRHRRRMGDSGRLENSIAGKSRRCRTKGNLRPASEAGHGGVKWPGRLGGFAKPASLKIEIRGDSKINRRHGQRTRKAGQLAERVAGTAKGCGAGQPANALLAELEGAGTGQPETRPNG